MICKKESNLSIKPLNFLSAIKFYSSLSPWCLIKTHLHFRQQEIRPQKKLWVYRDLSRLTLIGCIAMLNS